MKYKYLASGIVVGALGLSLPAHAQQEQELDIIMDVVEESEEPNEIIQRIELPPPANARVNASQLENASGIELNELQRQALRNEVETLLRDVDITVSDAVNDALASGNLDQLIDLLDDELPADVIEDLTNDIGDLTEDLTDDVIDDITDDVDNLTDDVDDLTDDLDNVTDELDNLTDDVDNVTDQVDDLSNDVDDITNELEDVTNEVDGATESLDAAVDDLPLQDISPEPLLEDGLPVDQLPNAELLN